MERAEAYLAAHPDLPARTAAAIRSNTIHDGMTMPQVIAAWGRPVVVQKFREGKVEHWFFGCVWPHFCEDVDFSLVRRWRANPGDIYKSNALFENGVVVDWGR